MRVQVIASTHAPLVLATLETIFDEERDRLLHFALRDGKIAVEEIPWAKQGDVVNWLVSEAFGLQQARSRDDGNVSPTMAGAQRRHEAA